MDRVDAQTISIGRMEADRLRKRGLVRREGAGVEDEGRRISERVLIAQEILGGPIRAEPPSGLARLDDEMLEERRAGFDRRDVRCRIHQSYRFLNSSAAFLRASASSGDIFPMYHL